MPRDIHAQTAQLLNQSPHFGAVGGNLLGNLGAADDNRSALHQQTHNAAETEIGSLWLVRCGRFDP
jgi:hypothetical protein